MSHKNSEEIKNKEDEDEEVDENENEDDVDEEVENEDEEIEDEEDYDEEDYDGEFDEEYDEEYDDNDDVNEGEEVEERGDESTEENEIIERKETTELLFDNFEKIAKEKYNTLTKFLIIDITEKNIDSFIKVIHNNFLEYHMKDSSIYNEVDSLYSAYNRYTMELFNYCLSVFCDNNQNSSDISSGISSGIKSPCIDFCKKFGITKKEDIKKALFNLLNDSDELYIWLHQSHAKQVNQLVSNIQYANRKDIKEGLHICKRCKSGKVMERLVALRSGDESLSILLSCLNCGWGKRID